jgi:excisionase family DNA binding protein
MRSGYLSSHTVAKLVSVSPSTVLTWIDSGLLPAHRTLGGHRRVAPGALVRFLRDHHMPVPDDLAPVQRLLVIDDEAPFLSTMTRLLRRHAPRVTVATAEGSTDGLLKVATFHPDAVLLDAFMPGIDGVQMCHLLRQSPETAHIMVIAVTGRPSPDIEAAFAEAGAVACLTKPVDAASLLRVLGVEQLMEARQS